MDINTLQKPRIQSIDLLRGLVMIIMALDHVRDYFHTDVFLFDPTDLTKTNMPLFFTRWITHFCAPVFMLLSGTSAFIMGQKKTKKQLSLFLLTRGLWLIFLEMTIVGFGWSFDIHFNHFGFLVIWALGASMIAVRVKATMRSSATRAGCASWTPPAAAIWLSQKPPSSKRSSNSA